MKSVRGSAASSPVEGGMTSRREKMAKTGKERERGIKEKNTREDIEYHSPLIFLQNHLLPGKRKLSMS